MNGLGSFAEVLTSVLIVLGSSFALIGSWGLVRLPTLMERLHGPTKATTLGLGGMLVGSVLYFQLAQGTWSAHELLISLFLFITAPIAANMIAKVHLHQLRIGKPDTSCGPAGPPPKPPPKPPADLPEAGDWATHQAPLDGSPASTSEG
jgi:multicomponent K+:H+ antiporter subunit G